MTDIINLFQISDTNVLHRLLTTDELTALYNRRYFRQYLDELKNEAEGKAINFVLLFLDIDNFKEFNDNYGHSCGDNVLIEVAKILRDTVGDKGKIFRYAGDEFTVIMPNAKEDAGITLCEEILTGLKKGFRYEIFEQGISKVSLSIGYARYPEEGTTIAQVMDKADKALYYAKRFGRGCYIGGSTLIQTSERINNNWPPVVFCRELVGRIKELNVLREMVILFNSGKGQVMLIEGEAGIGKSRLIRHFAKSLRAGDYNIIIGECNNSTSLIPYQPFREGLSHAFEAKDPRILQCFKQLDKHYRRELVKFIPSFARYDDDLESVADTSIDKFLLYQSILQLLVSFAKVLPVILILDDIHWADEASLNLIVYLARQTENEKIIICTCFREEEAPNSNFYHMMQSMSRESRVKHLKLHRLNEEAVAKMINNIFDSYKLSEEFKLWVHQESEGNPFYVEEIIKSLLEEAKITKKNGEVIIGNYMNFGLPHSIKELILRRILRLSVNEQRILGYASVIGSEFTVDLLSRMLEEDESYVLDFLDKARKAFIIREIVEEQIEKYAFYHNKIKETIYLEMGFIKRKKLHLRLAELIEKVDGNYLSEAVEILAFHYDKAQIFNKAYKYSLLAAEKAAGFQSYMQAIIYLEKCLQYRRHLAIETAEVQSLQYRIEQLKSLIPPEE